LVSWLPGKDGKVDWFSRSTSRHSPLIFLVYDTIPGIDNIPANVTLHGYLKNQCNINPILSLSTAAIGTISLTRRICKKQLPWKDKRWCSYGFPWSCHTKIWSTWSGLVKPF
jgi:hypothetical protein